MGQAGRVAVCSGLWSRLELAPFWWRGLCRIREAWGRHGIEVEFVVGGSEPAHRELCHAHGGEWVEVRNNPLGAKWNATVSTAFHQGVDYILVLGADDFLADNLLELYVPHILGGATYVGLRSLYYYDLATGRTCLWPGYVSGHWRRGEPAGAGRLIHRSLLGNGQPWDDRRDSGLDRSMTKKLGLPRAQLLEAGPNALAIDVKTAENIWSFDQVARPRRSPIEVDPPFLSAWDEWTELRVLRSTGSIAA